MQPSVASLHSFKLTVGAPTQRSLTWVNRLRPLEPPSTARGTPSRFSSADAVSSGARLISRCQQTNDLVTVGGDLPHRHSLQYFETTNCTGDRRLPHWGVIAHAHDFAAVWEAAVVEDLLVKHDLDAGPVAARRTVRPMRSVSRGSIDTTTAFVLSVTRRLCLAPRVATAKVARCTSFKLFRHDLAPNLSRLVTTNPHSAQRAHSACEVRPSAS
jgi:hypothetical protein